MYSMLLPLSISTLTNGIIYPFPDELVVRQVHGETLNDGVEVSFGFGFEQGHGYSSSRARLTRTAMIISAMPTTTRVTKNMAKAAITVTIPLG